MATLASSTAAAAKTLFLIIRTFLSLFSRCTVNATSGNTSSMDKVPLQKPPRLSGSRAPAIKRPTLPGSLADDRDQGEKGEKECERRAE
jgi:hypothetical protein